MPLIEIENLSKTYVNEGAPTPALQNLTFSIAEGEFVAIMGPSGSGKSTLLHILGFLDNPTEGLYRFEGKSMDDHPESELAHIRNKKMGFVFQSFNLLPHATVLENVKLPLLYSDVPDTRWEGMAKRAVESVGLAHRMEHEAFQLSGGEKQRVAIARALVREPQVIFADEPTGNLDSKSGKVIMEIVQRLNEKEGKTIILITHETYTAEHAHRIIRVRDGTVESDTTVKTRHHARDHFEK